MQTPQRFAGDELHRFCTDALLSLGVPAWEAEVTADVLIYADLRGIDSHGVAHLERYVNSLRTGAYATERDIVVVHQTPSTALIDGGNGLGYPTAVRAMEIAIEKAREVGSAYTAARNSHHFGAAGFYASMALEHDMIGFCATNAGPHVAPTFGIQGMCGTNPIAMAVPANQEPPFVLDMATCVKAIGKLEILIREEQEAPEGWFTHEDGTSGGDPQAYLKKLLSTGTGGLLPLGGAGEVTSGYKGYGLGLAVELLGPVLAGDTPCPFMQPSFGRPEPTRAHFFGAIRIDAFQPANEFKAEVDRVLAHIKASPRAPGHDRIWVAGEKEDDALKERSSLGVPLHRRVIETLDQLAEELDIAPIGAIVV